MAQLKQTASVTNGSQAVSMTGNFASQIKAKYLFMVDVDLVPYFVAADAVYNASANLTTFNLTGNYQGATNTAAGGLVVTDYTAPDLIPMIRQGDVGTAAIFAQAMLKIQTLLNAAAQPKKFAQYTLTTLPPAATNNGAYIEVTNATGGAKLCRSDGVNWKIANTTTTVS